MITISISHIIHLNKKERYDLYHGKEIEKNGFFVPVCFYKGNTSEPATEVFCKYYLTNFNEFVPITKCKNGYRINIYSDQQNQQYLSNPIGLLDPIDGGVQGFQFKERGQIRTKNQTHTLIHTVIIEDESILENSVNDI